MQYPYTPVLAQSSRQEFTLHERRLASSPIVKRSLVSQQGVLANDTSQDKSLSKYRARSVPKRPLCRRHKQRPKGASPGSAAVGCGAQSDMRCHTPTCPTSPGAAQRTQSAPRKPRTNPHGGRNPNRSQRQPADGPDRRTRRSPDGAARLLLWCLEPVRAQGVAALQQKTELSGEGDAVRLLTRQSIRERGRLTTLRTPAP